MFACERLLNAPVKLTLLPPVVEINANDDQNAYDQQTDLQVAHALGSFGR
jgi:hypothetical protein